MFKTLKCIVAMTASIAIPCAVAQTMSSDQQVVTPKPVPKMTAEEKKADKAAKRVPAPAPAAGATQLSSDQQVTTLKAPPKMTAEEKKADKAAKRKAPTAEEQAKQAKQTPG